MDVYLMVAVCHIVFFLYRRIKIRRYNIGHTYGALLLYIAVGMT